MAGTADEPVTPQDSPIAPGTRNSVVGVVGSAVVAGEDEGRVVGSVWWGTVAGVVTRGSVESGGLAGGEASEQWSAEVEAWSGRWPVPCWGGREIRRPRGWRTGPPC